MSSIVSCEDDNPYKPSSLSDVLAFWGYVYQQGRLIKVLLLLGSSLGFFLLVAYVIGDLIDDAPGSLSLPVISFAVIVLISMIIFYPSMPRLYRVQFKDRLRPGIPEEELRVLLTGATVKSLELTAFVLDVVCGLCTLVYVIGELFSLPDRFTVILLAVIAVDTLLLSLIAVSLSRANLDFIHKTFSEDDYKRYSRLGHYQRIMAALVIVNVLVAIFLYVTG